jgi:hypothetical protein
MRKKQRCGCCVLYMLNPRFATFERDERMAGREAEARLSSAGAWHWKQSERAEPSIRSRKRGVPLLAESPAVFDRPFFLDRHGPLDRHTQFPRAHHPSPLSTSCDPNRPVTRICALPVIFHDTGCI